MRLLWTLFLLPLVCNATPPFEEIIMYEVTWKPYNSSSFVVDVGGFVGDIQVSLTRDNDAKNLSGLQIKYGDIGAVVLEREALDCIPNPSIEIPMFFYTEPGDRDKIPDDWFNSVQIQFYIEETDSESGDSSIAAPLYPYIEFEFSGFKLNRIKVRKSPTQVRFVKDIAGQCPRNLIDWVR